MTDSNLLFSQREGYTKPPESLQLENLPDEIRNEIELCLFKAMEQNFLHTQQQTADWDEIIRDIWVQFLDRPLSSYPGITHAQQILIHFIHIKEFNYVFDLIIELVNRTAKDQPQFYKELKKVFERRKVAYQLVGEVSTGFTIIPTTNKLEVNTVTETFDLLTINAPRFNLVSKHLIDAGKYLKDGRYGKSIASSSSAIETTLRILTNCDNDFTKVFHEYCKSIQLHRTIQKSIQLHYAFASDISDGRHGSKQSGYNADFFDAQRSFTHSCSDVQYLINKKK